MKSRYGVFCALSTAGYGCDLVALGRSSLVIFIALIVVVRRKSVAPPEDMAAKLAKADEMLEREKE